MLEIFLKRAKEILATRTQLKDFMDILDSFQLDYLKSFDLMDKENLRKSFEKYFKDLSLEFHFFTKIIAGKSKRKLICIIQPKGAILFTSPSEMAKDLKWFIYQEQENFSFNHGRPIEAWMLPVTLKSKALANYFDSFDHTSVEENDLIHGCQLCVVASNLFSKENDRRNESKVRNFLFNSVYEVESMYFKPETVRLEFQIQTNAKMENCIVIEEKVVKLGEIKNELSGNGCPLIQAMTFFQQSRKISSTSTDACLLMVSMGSLCAVYGLSSISNERTICELLVPWRHLTFSPWDKSGIIHAAKLLKSVKLSLRPLAEESIVADDFPYQRHAGSREFHYIRRMHDSLVFEIQFEDDQSSAVVKFTKKYGRNVHEHLAQLGKAPKLIYQENLIGGWIMTIMEKVVGYDDLLDENGKKILSEILQDLHQNQFVHGDIR